MRQPGDSQACETARFWLAPSAAALALLIPALLWPSLDVHDDAFDELLAVEAEELFVNPKHPGGEVVLRGTYLLAKAFGYTGRAAAIAQVQNAVWLCVAIFFVTALGQKLTRSAVVPLLGAALLGCTFSGMHFRHDPYLFYWPQGLAVFALAAYLLLGARKSPPHLAVGGMLAAAVAINPMLLLPSAALAVGVVVIDSRLRWRPTLAKLTLPPVVVGALVLGGLRSQLSGASLYGNWPEEPALRMGSALWASVSVLEFLAPEGYGMFQASVVVLAALISGLALRLALWRRKPAPVVFIVAAAVHIVFVVWWDVGQLHFYYLVVTLLWIAALLALPQTTRRFRPFFVGAVGLAALGAAVTNHLSYLHPARSPENDVQSRLSKQPFKQSDILVTEYAHWIALEYFHRVRSVGWASLAVDYTPVWQPFAHFTAIQQAQAEAGQRLFVEVDAAGQLRLPEDLLPGSGPLLTAPELLRISLGERLEVDGRWFAQVTDLAEAPPCVGEFSGSGKGISFRASGYSEEGLNTWYAPANALDGNESSEWIAPEGRAASLEIKFSPAQRLARIRVLNARNRPHRDRATQSYTLTVYGEGGAKQSVQGRFPEPKDERQENVHSLGGSVHCLRLNLATHFGLSAGVAELSWE